MQINKYSLTETEKSMHATELWGEKSKTASEIHDFSNTFLQDQWTKKEFGSN